MDSFNIETIESMGFSMNVPNYEELPVHFPMESSTDVDPVTVAPGVGLAQASVRQERRVPRGTEQKLLQCSTGNRLNQRMNRKKNNGRMLVDHGKIMIKKRSVNHGKSMQI